MNKLNILYSDIPTDYSNFTGVAYLQWAMSYVTEMPPINQPSVVFATNTAVGYPEIFYFNMSYFYPALTDTYKEQFQGFSFMKNTSNRS